MATNSIPANLAVKISANVAQFLSGLSKTQNSLTSFTGGITKMAGALGIAFGVKQVADFAIEVSRLSGEAEAVSAAFARLPQSVKLMSELKQATGGTVSELDLMKRAVQASNFDISLSALPRLLEFATLRAQQTGQSVDYLVDSIVTGIGRKSKLILDNLGISAVQLTKALGGASAASSSIGDVADAVGRIAEENLKNMEGFAENASTKLQRLAASWVNLKVAAGDAANSTGFLGRTINGLTNTMDVLSGDKFTKGFNELLASGGKASKILDDFAAAGGKIDVSWQQLLERGFVRTESAARKYEKILKDISTTQKDLALARGATTIDPITGLPTSGGKKWEPEKVIETLNTLRDKEKELLAVFGDTDDADKRKLDNTAAQILAVRAQIKAIEDLIKVEEKRKPKELKMVFTPDLEAEGSQNPELRNDQARNQALDFADALGKVATSAEFAGGSLVKLENASNQTTTKMKSAWVDLSGVIEGAIGTIAEGLGGAIVGVENFGDAIIKAFAGFAKEFGSMLIASGIAALALDKLIVNPFAAIAAGAALVALAGAASASLSRAHEGLTGGGGSVGRTPSEVKVTGRSFVRGATIETVLIKNDYGRGRLG